MLEKGGEGGQEVYVYLYDLDVDWRDRADCVLCHRLMYQNPTRLGPDHRTAPATCHTETDIALAFWMSGPPG